MLAAPSISSRCQSGARRCTTPDPEPMSSLPLEHSATAPSVEVHEPGVFYMDPSKLPPPPIGSVGCRWVDLSGRTIAAGWVVGDHNDSNLLEGAHFYLEQRNEGVSPGRPATAFVPVRLELMQP